MNLSALHLAVRMASRGEVKSIHVSGIEREALDAWKGRVATVRELAISSGNAWGQAAPTPFVIAR